MNVGFIHSRINQENKLLLESFRKKGVKVTPLDNRSLFFDLNCDYSCYDVIMERSISYFAGLYISRLFEAMNVPVLNPSRIAEICGDKLLTSMVLSKNKIPTPRTMIAFNENTAKEAAKTIGYPLVMKPLIGSWARLLSKINDEESLESIIEHKLTLGHPLHHVLYLQKFIEKPSRDIRAYVIGNEYIGAIYRYSSHWITNTARGGEAKRAQIDGLEEVCVQTSEVIGNGMLAIDVMETDDGQLVVHEVNHNSEFRNAQRVTNIDIAGKMVDFVVESAKN